MFIVTTPEDGAYHNTDGMPTIFPTYEEALMAMLWRDANEWGVLELSKSEAHQITLQAYLAIYGRRFGLDV